jgi:phosphatidylglycerophosphate synthase
MQARGSDVRPRGASAAILAAPGGDGYVAAVTWRALLTLPNLLSLSRIPLAAGFLLADGTRSRVALLGMASATDLLDGWLARRGGTASRWGALIDPIADKTFVLLALAAFAVRGELSRHDFMVLLARDIGTAVGALVAWLMPGLDPRDFKARMSGKIVTVLQLGALLVLCVAPSWTAAMVLAVGLASIVALGDYTVALGVRLHRSSADRP